MSWLFDPPGPTVVLAVNTPALVILLLLVLLAGTLIGRLSARGVPEPRNETLAETICRERNGGTHACDQCTTDAER